MKSRPQSPRREFLTIADLLDISQYLSSHNPSLIYVPVRLFPLHRDALA